MSLHNQYFLQTQAKQRASIRFYDGTMLHLNERTDAVLRSPHKTFMKKGALDEVVFPGTDHRVQTANAVAGATGTNYIVQLKGKGTTQRTIVVVLEGAVQVANSRGSVLVKTGEQTVVRQGQAPQPPKPADTRAAAGWTNQLPQSNLPINGALDANGGEIVAGPA
jgi:ferric-dicitrate binding protein FerR (iron transport regulator)